MKKLFPAVVLSLFIGLNVHAEESIVSLESQTLAGIMGPGSADKRHMTMPEFITPIPSAWDGTDFYTINYGDRMKWDVFKYSFWKTKSEIWTFGTRIDAAYPVSCSGPLADTYGISLYAEGNLKKVFARLHDMLLPL